MGDDRMLFVPVFLGEIIFSSLFFLLWCVTCCIMSVVTQCIIGEGWGGFYNISVHLKVCVEKGFFRSWGGWGMTEVKQIEKAPLLNSRVFFRTAVPKIGLLWLG